MNRRGQVFLMATIIIVGIMFSLVRISNKGVARDEPEAFFDLADEIGFETKRVLDYGVINSGNGENVEDLAKELLNKYSENIANEDVAFVYGDANSVSAYYYQPTTIEAVSILNGGVSVPITLINGHEIEAKYNSLTKKATINIRGNDYSFNLKLGQNFYFVLSKEDNNEQFVTVK